MQHLQSWRQDFHCSLVVLKSCIETNLKVSCQYHIVKYYMHRKQNINVSFVTHVKHFHSKIIQHNILHLQYYTTSALYIFSDPVQNAGTTHYEASPRIIRYLTELFSFDIEFYQFLRAKLMRSYHDFFN